MKPKMDCQETFRRLDDYLDRELATGEMAAVEEHLKDCERCSGEFEVERAVLEGIKQKLARLKLSDSVKNRIVSLLHQS